MPEFRLPAPDEDTANVSDLLYETRIFIVFQGGEGAGKSVQAQLLTNRLGKKAVRLSLPANLAVHG